jgi:predicted SnoaL-like aldol condensation-catalyzing enzyme
VQALVSSIARFCSKEPQNVDRKTLATDLLRLAAAGDRAALERLVTPGTRHHNPCFAAGMPALLDAMVEAAKSAPDRVVDVKRVLADGDYVVVHSHIRHGSGNLGHAVVHIFRFEGDRIAEMWDVGQEVPAEIPNSDGMF